MDYFNVPLTEQTQRNYAAMNCKDRQAFAVWLSEFHADTGTASPFAPHQTKDT
jgi:hypothetical protein